MNSKFLERERVIKLRKKGFTYREILKEVSVSKSSVSLWLKDFPLTDTEKGILRERKESGSDRGRTRAAASLRSAKEGRDKILFEESKKEFLKYVENPFFQVGVSLYWAEGTKRTTVFAFTNSDLQMVTLMIKWIREFLPLEGYPIKLRVFTHKAFSGENHEDFWSSHTGIPLSQFNKTIYKSHTGLITKKRPNYKGCARIELSKVKFLRKMLFWQQMLIEYYEK